MNFDSFDGYPDLKQAVEDCYEAQDGQTDWIIRNHPGVMSEQVAVELLYHLMLRLLWLGEGDFAENALIRKDEGRRRRLGAISRRVLEDGFDAVPEMVTARDAALQWGALPGVLADDISELLEVRVRSHDEEMRLTRLHNEAAAAAARVEDMMGEDVALFVFGVAQTRDRVGRLPVAVPAAS